MSYEKGPLIFFDQGKQIDAYNFDIGDFTVPGLARAFARINRFAGGGIELEVVTDAQHQVTLSYLVPKGLEKAALIHEFSELWMGDIPYPVKRLCSQFDEMEERITRRACKVFEVPYSEYLELQPFDRALGRDEARFLFPDAIIHPDEGLGIEVVGMTKEHAATEWMRRFYELFGSTTHV